MTIIHYLLRNYCKFTEFGLVGFGLVGVMEMAFEALLIYNLLGIK